MAAASTRKKPPVPKDLGKEAAKLWRTVVGEYDLRPDELRILQEACREIDIIELLEEEQADSPVMVTGSMGQLVISPMISELRQHRTVLSALLKALKLPDEGADAGSASGAGTALANARWNPRRGAA